MISGYRSVDKADWPRREIFDFFSGLAYPFYMVTFELEVTRLHEHSRANGLSFYHCMIAAVTKAVNSVEAFRYAVADGRLILLGERVPSFTHLDRGSELFRIITLPCRGSFAEFCRDAKEKTESQTAFIEPAAEGPDLIYISCLPWLSLTALTNEHDCGAAAVKDDSIPRIAWGRIKKENGRELLNLSVEVNHRFIDGVHIGMLASELEKIMKEL